MTILPSLNHYRRSLESLLRTHRVLVIILLALFVAALSPRFLRGQLVGSLGGGSSSSSLATSDDLRGCSSTDTIFASDESLTKVRNIYLTEMNAIFTEHETLLRTPSQWKCGAGSAGEPAAPALQQLAAKLPGWHIRPTFGGTPVGRPITFDAFSAVAAELQREYECKLVELQDRAISLVARNEDLTAPLFCCTKLGCVPDVGAVTCDTVPVSSPQCAAQCPVYLTMPDFAHRVPLFDSEAGLERQKSRNALERSLAAIRSAEVNYAVARQLLCYERASLDLRAEMSLLADAVSCMPKIWDAVTSIHDRKE